MSCQCAPALLQLRKEIDARWPNRDKASDGCCGDAAHAARTSDHNPTDGYAHALDIDEDLDADTHSLGFLVPILLADSRTKYVIYEGVIYYPPSTSKPYTGINAHKQHLHLSIKATATFETRSWLSAPTPPPEDDMPPSPAICFDTKGRRWVFVNSSGSLFGRREDDTGFRPFGGQLTSAPDAHLGPDGLLNVVARGNDGASWLVKINPDDFSKSGWVSLGGKS